MISRSNFLPTVGEESYYRLVEAYSRGKYYDILDNTSLEHIISYMACNDDINYENCFVVQIDPNKAQPNPIPAYDMLERHKDKAIILNKKVNWPRTVPKPTGLKPLIEVTEVAELDFEVKEHSSNKRARILAVQLRYFVMSQNGQQL